MDRLIRLSEDEKSNFSNFIKDTRSRIIPKPQETLSIVLQNYDKSSINLTTISQTINELRELSYNEFLAFENNFNATILENISSKFEIANSILSRVSKEFFDNLPTKYDEFQSCFTKYFGCYAGEISPYIYELCLSNTQSRRSRAGKIFEAIIYFLYQYFDYSFNSQAKVGKRVFGNLGLGKVVDSILPSIEAFENFRNKTIVGSMKTTLRERWQEVVEEIDRSNLPNIYLLTCDTDLSTNKIKQMAEHNIVLVVFNSVKANLQDFRNVISFETYFSSEIPAVLEYWDKNK